MKLCIKIFTGSLLKTSAGIVILGSLGACATSSAPNQAASAPITYKIGTQYASLNSGAVPRAPGGHAYQSQNFQHPMPYTAPNPTAPKDSAPQSLGPQMTAPNPSSAPMSSTPQYADDFDMSTVDQNLYAHQKIGKTYSYQGTSYTPRHQPTYNVVGTASWYGDKYHGKPTASGEKFNKNAMTAAHKTLPLNSMVRVTNLENGTILMLRVNDRGPFIGDRIIDLSEGAARKLGTQSNGLALVRVQYAGPADVSASPMTRSYAPVPRSTPKRSIPERSVPERSAPEPNSMIAEAPSYPPSRPILPRPSHPLSDQADGQAYAPLREQAPRPAPAPIQPTPMPYIPPVQDLAPTSPASPNSEAQVQAPTEYQNDEYWQEDYDYESESQVGVEQSYGTTPQAQPEYDPTMDGGTVTLTIKGPIHMAKSESVIKDNSTKPSVIPAHFVETIPSRSK